MQNEVIRNGDYCLTDYSKKSAGKNRRIIQEMSKNEESWKSSGYRERY